MLLKPTATTTSIDHVATDKVTSANVPADNDSMINLMESIVRFALTRQSLFSALTSEDDELVRGALTRVDPEWEERIPSGYELEILRQPEGRAEAVVFVPDRKVFTILLPPVPPFKMRRLASTIDPQTPLANCSGPW